MKCPTEKRGLNVLNFEPLVSRRVDVELDLTTKSEVRANPGPVEHKSDLRWQPCVGDLFRREDTTTKILAAALEKLTVRNRPERKRSKSPGLSAISSEDVQRDVTIVGENESDGVQAVQVLQVGAGPRPVNPVGQACQEQA
ncbi:hypothetical protein GSI_00208 [Ganoderma sinense ZZ0214-1]|uniref:Uncharacterized protein n=1 Tax=Ganoderma sinense ZZ0214-1 TaxID=1077348 RepID=A0A2G8SRX2_9APHY|nr:hypothetical protein GSI_00208 [Ganoderma sinense ZZ0214-1]